MRYIDADLLRAAMYHEAFEKDSDMQKWDSGCWVRYKLFENIIDKIPTVDFEEVKHGQWLANSDEHMDIGFICSSCGKDQADISGFLCCPWCGAKMDL